MSVLFRLLLWGALFCLFSSCARGVASSVAIKAGLVPQEAQPRAIGVLLRHADVNFGWTAGGAMAAPRSPLAGGDARVREVELVAGYGLLSLAEAAQLEEASPRRAPVVDGGGVAAWGGAPLDAAGVTQPPAERDAEASDAQKDACSVVLSKLNYDNPGADEDEFLELQAVGVWSAGATLTECGVGSLILRNGGQADCPEYRRLELAQLPIPVGGFVLICARSHAGCAWGETLPNGWIQNGPNDTVELVSPEGDSVAMYAYGVLLDACIDGKHEVPALALPQEPANDAVDSVIVRCRDATYRLLPKAATRIGEETDCAASVSAAPTGTVPASGGQAGTRATEGSMQASGAGQGGSASSGRISGRASDASVGETPGSSAANPTGLGAGGAPGSSDGRQPADPVSAAESSAATTPSDEQRAGAQRTPGEGRILEHRVVEWLEPSLSDAAATSIAPERRGLPRPPPLPGSGCAHARRHPAGWSGLGQLAILQLVVLIAYRQRRRRSARADPLASAQAYDDARAGAAFTALLERTRWRARRFTAAHPPARRSRLCSSRPAGERAGLRRRPRRRGVTEPPGSP